MSEQAARTPRPTAVDLFSGCGGLTVGLKAAGFRVICAVENDYRSIRTYRANHRGVKVIPRDIRTVDPQEAVQTTRGAGRSVDLVAGCPPCQGFSTMRTLNGALTIDDPRNALLWEFYRFVEELMPKAVMLENVPGLACDEMFDRFCTKMTSLGYEGSYRVLDAADYGVPQHRRRLIYLAGRNIEVGFAPTVSPRPTVRDAIAKLGEAGASGDPIHDLPEHRSRRVVEIIKQVPADGGSRSQVPAELRLDCHTRCDGFKDVYGRMAWDRPAPTITSGCFNPSKGRFLHPDKDRCITMREAALLQSFPPDYQFPTTESKSAIALMIGNALPPPLIQAHAEAIRKVL